MEQYPAGQLVFFDHPDHSWVNGEVVEPVNAKGLVKVVDKSQFNSGTCEVKVEQLYSISTPEIITEDVDDLLQLSELHNSTLLNTLRRRYMNDVVYTYIGPIVIAINPFNYNIPWYRDDFMPNYLAEGEVIQRNKPHSWSVAHNTYYEMMNDRKNQSILVSGESGAGKTEAVKIVIKYIRGLMNKLARDAAHRTQLEEVNKKVLLASPILEAFGNAKTGRNDNSSRFGKFLQVQFDKGGFIAGSFAINYLIERSRVVTAAVGERVYHAFYQVAKGKDATGQYRLSSPKDFPSLISGKTLDIASMEDAEGEDLSYRVSNECFHVCGVPEDSVDAVWRNVAAILHLLKVEFVETSPESCDIGPASSEPLECAADLWRIPADSLRKELLETVLEVKGQSMTMQHTKAKATVVLQTLAKSVYKGLFDWLFDALNATTSAEPVSRDGDSGGGGYSSGGGGIVANWIGLLDIFGFEDFKLNSFEQLCINLANETLQNHYNDYIFNKDMAECKAEGVDVTTIEFDDNTPTCKLLTDKLGIFALLDEECALGKGSDLGFLEKIANEHGSHRSFYKTQLMKSDFGVKHYAGLVKYEVENFLEKNRETLKDAFKIIFRSHSACAVTATVLPEPVDKKGRAPTVSGVFVRQINDLMDMINSTNPHWIRCIKPHPAKKPLMFHGFSSMNQMVSAGIMETVRIRALGFPVRLPHLNFVSRFGILAKAQGMAPTPANVVKAAGFGPEHMQVGKSKVFIKSAAYMELDVKKRAALLSSSLIAQSYARCVGSLLLSLRRTKISRLRYLQKELREWLVTGAEARKRRIAERAAAAAKAAAALASIGGDESAARGSVTAAEDAAWRDVKESWGPAMRALLDAGMSALTSRCLRAGDEILAAEAREWSASVDRFRESIRAALEARRVAEREEAERRERVANELSAAETTERRAIAAAEVSAFKHVEAAAGSFGAAVLEAVEGNMIQFLRLQGRAQHEAGAFVTAGDRSALTAAGGGAHSCGTLLHRHASPVADAAAAAEIAAAVAAEAAIAAGHDPFAGQRGARGPRDSGDAFGDGVDGYGPYTAPTGGYDGRGGQWDTADMHGDAGTHHHHHHHHYLQQRTAARGGFSGLPHSGALARVTAAADVAHIHARGASPSPAAYGRAGAPPAHPRAGSPAGGPPPYRGASQPYATHSPVRRSASPPPQYPHAAPGARFGLYAPGGAPMDPRLVASAAAPLVPARATSQTRQLEDAIQRAQLERAHHPRTAAQRALSPSPSPPTYQPHQMPPGSFPSSPATAVQTAASGASSLMKDPHLLAALSLSGAAGVPHTGSVPGPSGGAYGALADGTATAQRRAAQALLRQQAGAQNSSTAASLLANRALRQQLEQQLEQLGQQRVLDAEYERLQQLQQELAAALGGGGPQVGPGVAATAAVEAASRLAAGLGAGSPQRGRSREPDARVAATGGYTSVSDQVAGGAARGAAVPGPPRGGHGVYLPWDFVASSAAPPPLESAADLYGRKGRGGWGKGGLGEGVVAAPASGRRTGDVGELSPTRISGVLVKSLSVTLPDGSRRVVGVTPNLTFGAVIPPHIRGKTWVVDADSNSFIDESAIVATSGVRSVRVEMARSF